MEIFQGGLFNGICFGIAAIGISLPLRFLGTADFTSIGTYMLGGILSVYFANLTSNPFIGLVLGVSITGILGVITAYMSLNKYLNISLMLGGIITFTASRSFGLFLAKGASIDLMKTVSPFSPIFSWSDVITVTLIALLLSIILGVLARSKYGCLAFALCTNTNFVKFRHSLSGPTIYWIMYISNLIIALSGSLMVYKMGTAYPIIDVEFLAISIGAIFSGDAFIRLVSRFLRYKSPFEVNYAFQENNSSVSKGFWQEFRLRLSPQRDDTEKMWFILISYIIAAMALSDIGAGVAAKKILNISSNWEHFIIAGLITFSLLLSNIGNQKVEK